MIMLKIALLLVKIYVLVGKKGISEFLHWLAQNHTAKGYSKLYKRTNFPTIFCFQEIQKPNS